MNEGSNAVIDTVTHHLAPIADDFAIEIVDIELQSGVLRITIDEPDGLSNASLVEVTKAVSRMIDREDPVPGRFTLEVTSPGVERPLKRPEHFKRSIGADVAIKTQPNVDGERRFEGVLTAADEAGVIVSDGDAERSLRYGEIKSARTVFIWGPGPKPGGKTKVSRADTATKES